PTPAPARRVGRPHRLRTPPPPRRADDPPPPRPPPHPHGPHPRVPDPVDPGTEGHDGRGVPRLAPAPEQVRRTGPGPGGRRTAHARDAGPPHVGADPVLGVA